MSQFTTLPSKQPAYLANLAKALRKIKLNASRVALADSLSRHINELARHWNTRDDKTDPARDSAMHDHLAQAERLSTLLCVLSPQELEHVGRQVQSVLVIAPSTAVPVAVSDAPEPKVSPTMSRLVELASGLSEDRLSNLVCDLEIESEESWRE